MKKLTIGYAVMVALFVGSLLFPACGKAGEYSDRKVEPSGNGLIAQTVTLNDGRTVECVAFDGIEAGGLDCDFSISGPTGPTF